MLYDRMKCIYRTELLPSVPLGCSFRKQQRNDSLPLLPAGDLSALTPMSGWLKARFCSTVDQRSVVWRKRFHQCNAESVARTSTHTAGGAWRIQSELSAIFARVEPVLLLRISMLSSVRLRHTTPDIAGWARARDARARHWINLYPVTLDK